MCSWRTLAACPPRSVKFQRPRNGHMRYRMGFLTWIVVGLIGGWLARKVMEGSRYGVLLDIFLGIVGSIAGGWTLALLGIRGIGTIIVSFLGAVFLVWISRLITARPEEVEVKEIARPAEDSAPPPQRPTVVPSRPDETPAVRRSEPSRPAPSASTGYDIFISYASADRPHAQALATALHGRGWSVWWDRTIPPGKSFDVVIEAALNAAKCVIVLWSPASVTSEW